MTSRRRLNRAFTLIELLVVIAIISLMISILLPALARARYMSNLTKCAAHQRQVAIAANVRATDNKEFWQPRVMPFNSMDSSYPFNMKSSGWDDRPGITSYIPLNEVGQCPLNPFRDYENATTTNVQGSYSFYFGFQLSPGQQALERLGDLMTFPVDPTDAAGAGDKYEFDILVSDMMWYRTSSNTLWTAHPDNIDASKPQVRGGAGDSLTTARYILGVPATAGALDMNFTRTDGSGFRVGGVAVEDPRLIKVTARNRTATEISSRWSLLPDVNY